VIAVTAPTTRAIALEEAAAPGLAERIRRDLEERR
jgi:hypothetical protein